MDQQFKKVSIVKLFASNEYKVRNKAFKVIKILLKNKFGDGKGFINKTEIKGIWKGFYTWLWMQDKPLLHQEVVGKICSLLNNEITNEKVAITYIKCFYITMKREWGNIDIHRKDKFYMLVRDFTNSTLTWCNENLEGWTKIDKFLLSEVLTDGPTDLKMHLVDVLIQEMVKIDDLNEEIIFDIILMLITFCGDGRDVFSKRVRNRLSEDLIGMAMEGDLQIDLSDVALVVMNLARSNTMGAKTRKFLLFISDLFTEAANMDFDENEDGMDVDDFDGELGDSYEEYEEDVEEDNQEDDVEEDNQEDDVEEDNQEDDVGEDNQEDDVGEDNQEDDVEEDNQEVDVDRNGLEEASEEKENVTDKEKSENSTRVKPVECQESFVEVEKQIDESDDEYLDDEVAYESDEDQLNEQTTVTVEKTVCINKNNKRIRVSDEDEEIPAPKKTKFGEKPIKQSKKDKNNKNKKVAVNDVKPVNGKKKVRRLKLSEIL